MNVKQRSEEIIVAAGGRVCQSLPELQPRQVRTQEEIAGRLLVLYAMVHLAYRGPAEVVEAWIESNGLTIFASPEERRILSSRELSDYEEVGLYWSIEALWALAWVLSLMDDLPFDQRAGEKIPCMLPNLLEGEDCSAARSLMRVRPYEELFAQLDLYFRLEWYTSDNLKRFVAGPVSHDLVRERHRALEWALSRRDWDEVLQGL